MTIHSITDSQTVDKLCTKNSAQKQSSVDDLSMEDLDDLMELFEKEASSEDKLSIKNPTIANNSLEKSTLYSSSMEGISDYEDDG